jgi:hypothetical protein
MDFDGHAIHHEVASFYPHFSGKPTMDAVIFEEVGQGLDVGEVIDGDYAQVFSSEHLAEGQTTNSSKSVDGDVLHLS